jgi:PAS domain S-box-containing protein
MDYDNAMTTFPEKMFNTTSAAVVVFNLAGEIVWINKAFEDSFGYHLAHLKDTNRWPFLEADHQEKFSSIVRQAFSGDPLELFQGDAQAHQS